MAVINVNTEQQSKLTWYDIDCLDLQHGKVTVTLDQQMLPEIIDVCYNTNRKSLRSLVGKLAKIGHIFAGRANIKTCLGSEIQSPIADEIYDNDGTQLR